MLPLLRTMILAFRKLVHFCESFIALPASLVFIIIGYFCILMNRYTESSIFVSKIPFYFGERVRCFYYKATLNHLGKDVTFKYGSFCHYRDISIGDRVLIGYYNVLGRVNIGNDVLSGCFVTFTSGLNHHSFEDPASTIASQSSIGPITIHVGNDIWIGNNALICADIADRSVVGAGSVVVKPIEGHSVYAGNPARLLRKI